MKADFQISYFLWKARKDKNGLIPLYIRSKQNSDKQISYNTGMKLTSDEWKRYKKNKPAELMTLERSIKETYKHLVADGHTPSLDLILKNLNTLKRPSDNSIVVWCDHYDKAEYSDGMRKAVRTVKSNITNFNEALTFDQLTQPRIKAFFDFLSKKGVANNSQYKRLRALVNVAHHANINCPTLTSYRLPYTKKNSIKTRLTWAEVKAVIGTPTETKLEGIAKDAFLLACFSGLRISDLLTLNVGELSNYYYERIQTKTGETVFVTIHKYNESLFKKYINTGIPYTRQRLSSALKKVLERSGLTKQISRKQDVGYKKKETILEKYKEISFHSGRRFYARLLNDLGLGSEIARDELGHGFKNITDLYAGSPDHMLRVARVRQAMKKIDKTLKQLALMKVA